MGTPKFSIHRSWQRFHETFFCVVYFGCEEHEWTFLAGIAEPLDDPVQIMAARLGALRYRPRTVDAESLAASTIPPRALRLQSQ